MSIDFSKVLSEEEVKTVIPITMQFFEDIIKKESEKYGEAVFIKNQILSTQKDSMGNYTEINEVFAEKLDLNKISHDKLADSIITDVFLSLKLNLKTGVSIDGYVVLNPTYRDAWKILDIVGSLIEDFISHKPSSMDILHKQFTELDALFSNVIEKDNGLYSTVMGYIIENSK